MPKRKMIKKQGLIGASEFKGCVCGFDVICSCEDRDFRRVVEYDEYIKENETVKQCLHCGVLKIFNWGKK